MGGQQFVGGLSRGQIQAQIEATVAAAVVDDYPTIETWWQNLLDAYATVAGLTIFTRVPPRRAATPVTTARWSNGPTVNGNVAVSLWASLDGGVTLTRLGGTGSVVQAGINADQSAPLTAAVVVPPRVPLWLSVSESMGATGDYLYNSGLSTANGIGARVGYVASFNPTADVPTANLIAVGTSVWAMVH